MNNSISPSSMRWIALSCLVLQNSLLSICMRFSRISSSPDEMYIPSTAVIMSEAIKLIVASVVVLKERKMNFKLWQKDMISCVREDPIVLVKLMVPSMLYIVQNNLQYVAISNLHPALFQVLYQVKLLTTAVISYFLLSKRLSLTQWGSLVVLVAGISLVQVSQISSNTGSFESNIQGLLAVFVAKCTSGFAGVYFEKTLKASNTSVWLRSIQLALLGVMMGGLGSYAFDRQQIMEKGFFLGYSPLVWSAILLQAFGGMIVAVVVKYSDNVLKGFATSVSVILSSIVSIPLLNFQPEFMFVLGAFFVLLAVFGYGMEPSNSSKEHHKNQMDV